MSPPAGTSCGAYLEAYANASGGAVYNPEAMSDCQFCTSTVADQFLASVSISYTQRWSNYGIGYSYIIFNIVVAVLLYYFFRVRKGSGKKMGERLKPLQGLFKKDPEKENKGAEKAKAPMDQNEPLVSS